MSRPASQDWVGATCITRRGFFQRMSGGIYGAALTYLLGQDFQSGSGLCASEWSEKRLPDLKPRAPHFAPKAKSVIHLFMNGGPSQMDLFDPKPTLNKYHGRQYFNKI